ncbi:MAG: winged helix-turn-helix domain-containing protein, partial [Pseudomonas sp.]
MDTQNSPPRVRRKHRSLAQELVTELSQRIRDGVIKRGDKLPTESAIMEEQGVSRTVVREALSRLQAAG